MKRALFCGAAFCLMVLPLLAGTESISSKDSKTTVQQPVAPAMCNWTGFYVGVHGGYSWGDLSFKELGETDPAYEFDQDGFFGGGQVGFDWQFHPMFVLGVEGTFAGSAVDSDTEISPSGERSTANLESSWLGTIGGRLGVTLLQNRMLFYVKGGAAFTEFNYETQEVGGSEHFSASEDRTAGFVGGGLEYRWSCHWSAKLEYAHYFFGDDSVTGTETSGGGSGIEHRYSANGADRDSIAVGLNFRF